MCVRSELSSELRCDVTGVQPWIVDGFPRKASQAKLFDEMLARVGDPLGMVVFIDVPDRVILQRIEGASLLSLRCVVLVVRTHRPMGSRFVGADVQLQLQPAKRRG